VFCVGAVQFVNILDFIIVTPMGPDFAHGLGIPLDHLGYIGGAYTAAASISGLAGAFFLDRFDRRRALAVALAGLVLGTLSGALARGLATLMLARVVAGAFGGPATSLAYSIVADVIPVERRGKAMGAMMGAFAAASVLGVPAGLELARRGSWQLPFIAVAVLGAVIGAYAYTVLPPMTGHLVSGRPPPKPHDLLDIVRRPECMMAFAMAFLAMAAGFILIPNLSAFVLGNLHYERKYLGTLYLVGGIVSFFSTRLVGIFVDRFGSARVGTLGALFAVAITYAGFAMDPTPLPVMVIFVGLMFGNSLRMVSYNTLMSRVPAAEERARFASVQSSVQHLASALGAFTGSLLLSTRPDESLEGMPRVAMITIALSLCLVPLFFAIERRVIRRT